MSKCVLCCVLPAILQRETTSLISYSLPWTKNLSVWDIQSMEIDLLKMTKGTKWNYSSKIMQYILSCLGLAEARHRYCFFIVGGLNFLQDYWYSCHVTMGRQYKHAYMKVQGAIVVNLMLALAWLSYFKVLQSFLCDG